MPGAMRIPRHAGELPVFAADPVPIGIRTVCMPRPAAGRHGEDTVRTPCAAPNSK